MERGAYVQARNLKHGKRFNGKIGCLLEWFKKKKRWKVHLFNLLSEGKIEVRSAEAFDVQLIKPENLKLIKITRHQLAQILHTGKGEALHELLRMNFKEPEFFNIATDVCLMQLQIGIGILKKALERANLLNYRNEDGHTLLHQAILHRNRKALVQLCADVEIKFLPDNDGNTPFHLAFIENFFDEDFHYIASTEDEYHFHAELFCN